MRNAPCASLRPTVRGSPGGCRPWRTQSRISASCTGSSRQSTTMPVTDSGSPRLAGRVMGADAVARLAEAARVSRATGAVAGSAREAAVSAGGSRTGAAGPSRLGQAHQRRAESASEASSAIGHFGNGRRSDGTTGRERTRGPAPRLGRHDDRVERTEFALGWIPLHDMSDHGAIDPAKLIAESAWLRRLARGLVRGDDPAEDVWQGTAPAGRR